MVTGDILEQMIGRFFDNSVNKRNLTNILYDKCKVVITIAFSWQITFIISSFTYHLCSQSYFCRNSRLTKCALMLQDLCIKVQIKQSLFSIEYCRAPFFKGYKFHEWEVQGNHFRKYTLVSSLQSAIRVTIEFFANEILVKQILWKSPNPQNL